MFDSVVVDVVIAVALVFLVFSLVAAGLREFIARVLETRSKELWRTLRKLVDDPIASDFRELATLIADLDAPARTEMAGAIASAEATIREKVTDDETAGNWRHEVEAALAPVREAAATSGVDDKEFGAALNRTSRRLLLEHRRGSRAVIGVLRAGRRGGERPLVPEVPTPVAVGDLAARVRSRASTLADAVHEHPLVRQIDRTWPGYRSRLQRLDGPDFSAAMLDIVHAMGVEPALRYAFARPGRAIDRLQLSDAEKQALWQPMSNGMSTVKEMLQAGRSTDEAIDGVFRTMLEAFDDLVGEEERFELTDDEVAEVRDRIIALQSAVLHLNDDPVELIKAGAEYLDDTAPVKDVVRRLTARSEATVVDVRARLEDVQTSLESWYDGRMSALSGWYRRRSRIVAFGLGLLIVASFNLDAIRLPQELWQNENVRGVVVAVADESSLNLEGCLAADGVGAQVPADCVQAQVAALIETGIPIGWQVGTACDGICDGFPERFAYALGVGGRGVGSVFAKLLGWVLAAAALSMGASFWYDILRRATGAKRTMEKATQSG